VVRPWLAARTQPVTADIARSLGMGAPVGALVADIWPGGAAARAGLKQGDVIVSVDGQPLVDGASLNYAISTHRVGDTIRLGVRRGGGEQALTMRAEAPPATPERGERTLSGRNPFDGVKVVNLSPAVADELGADPFAGRGVLIVGVGRGLAMNAGFQPGDLVREVNGKKIETTADLAAAVAAPQARWRVVIERGGQIITAVLGV
jgi:S1-C subfamily serine protease